MKESVKQTLSIFVSLIRERFPDARIWAFGSQVRGTATQESDLDVCVVVERLDDAIDKEIMEIAWQVGFEHDLIISTITYSREEFEQGPCSASTLVEVILKEGLAA